jgi:hypothetical protein
MAYTYQAARWCDECAERIREELATAGRSPADPNDETSYDSDDFPKGPFSDDEESDSPDHCDAGEDCLCALELDDGRKVGAIVSGLTEDGIVYVRSATDSPCVRAWREHYGLDPFVVSLDNAENCDGFVMVTVRGPGVLRWAKDVRAEPRRLQPTERRSWRYGRNHGLTFRMGQNRPFQRSGSIGVNCDGEANYGEQATDR